MARPRLGDILLKLGFVDADQLQSAIGHQKQWGKPLARTLVEKRFCTIEQVMQALSVQTGFQVIDLDREPLGPQLAPLLPLKAAEQQHAVPLRVEGKRHEVLVVAIAAPATLEQLDVVTAAAGKQRALPLLAWDEAVERAIGRIYRGESFAPPPPPGAPAAEAAPVLDAREQELDLGEGDAELGAPEDPLAFLQLSEGCRRLVRNAAQMHRINESEVIAKILESWASKQRG